MITDKEYISEYLPKHPKDAHKGVRGRALIIGGSTGLTGAVCMAANAALKSGAGLITAAVPMSLNSIFEIKLTEVMTFPVDDTDGMFTVYAAEKVLGFAQNCDAVAIGPGAGKCSGLTAIVENFLRNYDKKLILDADALNVISNNTDILKNAACEVLITPHIGEMNRLCKVSIDEIARNRIKIAEEFAEEHSVNVLLKGRNTVITNGKQTFVNPTGNNGMAKGGSGDVLTGVCLGLAAQGVPVFQCGVLGAFLHGMAGDIAMEKYTDYSMTPTDIIDNLCNAFKKVI